MLIQLGKSQDRIVADLDRHYTYFLSFSIAEANYRYSHEILSTRMEDIGVRDRTHPRCGELLKLKVLGLSNGFIEIKRANESSSRPSFSVLKGPTQAFLTPHLNGIHSRKRKTFFELYIRNFPCAH